MRPTKSYKTLVLKIWGHVTKFGSPKNFNKPKNNKQIFLNLILFDIQSILV